MAHAHTNQNLMRYVDPSPFVPRDPKTLDARCREIANIMKFGLAKRLRYVAHMYGLDQIQVSLGLSGGLDSTSALLGVADTFDMLGWSRKNIITPNMPGFGSTEATKGIAKRLAEYFETDYRSISIVEATTAHLKSIGARCLKKGGTGEPCKNCLQCQNAQARKREQILLDLAFTVNTSDMSELFLGWSTFGADQFGMYCIQPGMPKTMVKHQVTWHAQQAKKRGEKELAEILWDAVNIQYSPELTEKPQSTEDFLGPYELHDFTMFHIVRNGFRPRKILFLQEQAAKIPTDQGGYSKVYTLQELARWMCVAYERFAPNQFKRGAAADGPQFGSVALSKTGAFRWPPEMDLRTWIWDIREIATMAS